MMYTCTKCGIEKPKSEYGVDRRNTIKGIRADCKLCTSAATKAWRERVGYVDKDKGRGLAWRNKNLEHCRKQERQRRKDNPEIAKRATRKWRAENGTEATSRYRARKYRAIPKWADMNKIKTVYLKAKQFGFHVDHIVPLCSSLVSGLHVWDNLQLLDKSLNSTKKNLSWPDMPQELNASQVGALPR